jgi:GntR family transcriptional regulator
VARQEVLDVGMVPAPADVAEWLRSDAGTLLGPDLLVARRRRLRLADDEPVQLATSYLPGSIAAGTMFMEPGNQVAPGGILAYIGYPQVRLEDRVIARQPTPEEARLLALPRGTAIAEHVRIGKGVDGVPVRVMVTIAPGDRNVLVYRIVV